MIVYKIRKHESKNNPALGEKPDLFVIFVFATIQLSYSAKAC